MVLECNDNAAVLYRKGEPVGSENQSSLFIPFVQPDDEGVYGGRSADDALEQRNLTVSGEIWHSAFSIHRQGCRQGCRQGGAEFSFLGIWLEFQHKYYKKKLVDLAENWLL